MYKKMLAPLASTVDLVFPYPTLAPWTGRRPMNVHGLDVDGGIVRVMVVHVGQSRPEC